MSLTLFRCRVTSTTLVATWEPLSPVSLYSSLYASVPAFSTGFGAKGAVPGHARQPPPVSTRPPLLVLKNVGQTARCYPQQPWPAAGAKEQLTALRSPQKKRPYLCTIDVDCLWHESTSVAGKPRPDWSDPGSDRLRPNGDEEQTPPGQVPVTSDQRSVRVGCLLS